MRSNKVYSLFGSQGTREIMKPSIHPGRTSFPENSVEQIIWDYWDNSSNTTSDFENALSALDKGTLVDFIMSAQSKGRFANGFITPNDN